ncbi:MAG: hypothetical protein KAV99_04980 [Candidatus Latescibacteria bacterium]|nr:hypothetical protein [Candidatus Latescibacterota bacterium]
MGVVFFLVVVLGRVLTRFVAIISFGLAIVALLVGVFSPLSVPRSAYAMLIAFGIIGGFIKVAWEDDQKIKTYASEACPELSVKIVPKPVEASLETRADYKTAHGGTTLKEFVSLRQLSRWVHAEVENTGRATARNCKVMLMDVWDEQGNPVTGFHYANMLHWSGMQDSQGAVYAPRDIQPGESVHFDICFTVEPPLAGIGHRVDLLHFATDKMPKGLRTDIGPGAYICHTRVLSDNSTPVDLCFRISWTGVSSDLTTKEVTADQCVN